ncbi:MAG: hypothetical protein GY880_09405, partial [Planctomycetaceae bacterium]|nr:hypothetical protein [Planctomycetaceae bacterium]
DTLVCIDSEQFNLVLGIRILSQCRNAAASQDDEDEEGAVEHVNYLMFDKRRDLTGRWQDEGGDFCGISQIA